MPKGCAAYCRKLPSLSESSSLLCCRSCVVSTLTRRSLLMQVLLSSWPQRGARRAARSVRAARPAHERPNTRCCSMSLVPWVDSRERA